MNVPDYRYPVALLILATVLAGQAADWPCFHGPDGLGVSPEKDLPVRWSKQENVAWRTRLPGKGASSPSVIDGRVYVTAQTEDTGLHALALDANDGHLIWDKELGKGRVKAHQLHNMATPTAVSDGKQVWVRFGTGLVVCLDARGAVVWERQLGKEFGDYNANHGMGTSPMLLDGRLFVACMHQGPSYLLAIDARTGKDLWKKDRNLEAKEEAQDSYSSPIIVRSPGWAGARLVLAGAEAVNCYDPKTGAEIWTHGGLKVPHPYGRTISGPAAGGGVVVAVASGFQNRGFTIGLQTEGQGSRPESDRLWTCSKFSPDCGTPVVYQGKVYFVRDDGIASCLDAKTGEAHWQERLFTANVKVSPVAGDGKVYFLNGQGNCTVVRASTKLETLATNELNETTLSSPAISNGRIYLRTDEGLVCIRK